MPNYFTVAERGLPIQISRDHLTFYSGPSQIIATALMFRLYKRAIADLSPDSIPERTDITTLVSFPGPGILDCVEYVSRARTADDGRLVIDSEAGTDDSPKALIGRFYFEIDIGGKRSGYWPVPGYFDDHFLDMVRTYQGGQGSVQEEADYQNFKQNIVDRILGADEKDLFVMEQKSF